MSLIFNMREADYYIKNKLKAPKHFFDWCNKNIPTIIWKNKKTMITSNREKDGCYVTEIRLAKNSNLTFYDKTQFFAIVLVTSKRIEIQSYVFYVSYNNGLQIIEKELSNIEVFSQGKHIKVGRKWSGRYGYGLTKNEFMGGAYTGTRLYANNWRDKIKEISELKYLDFPKTLHALDIAHIYKYRNEIEYTQKINAEVLAEEVMYPSHSGSNGNVYKTVDMRLVNRKWLQRNKSFFKNSTRSFNEFELNRRIRLRGGKMIDGIEEYLNYSNIPLIPDGIGLVRFQNWILKNKINFNYYLDYLSLMKDLGVECNTENLIIPKDLKVAHDNAVNLLNVLKIDKERAKNKHLEDKVTKRNKILKKYEVIIGDLVIVAPKELKEIMLEGKALNHCVGTSRYLADHASGKTTILFVRSKNSIDKSLYTLEFKNKKIIQCRGKYNAPAPKEVMDKLENWLNWINSNFNIKFMEGEYNAKGLYLQPL